MSLLDKLKIMYGAKIEIIDNGIYTDGENVYTNCGKADIRELEQRWNGGYFWIFFSGKNMNSVFVSTNNGKILVSNQYTAYYFSDKILILNDGIINVYNTEFDLVDKIGNGDITEIIEACEDKLSTIINIARINGNIDKIVYK